MKTLCTVLSLVLILSAAAIAQEEKAYDLRPKFKAGNKATFETWTLRTQTITMEAAGQSRDATVKTEFEARINWEVNTVNDDGSADCTVIIEWFKMTATPPEGEPRTVDTREAANEQNQKQHQTMSAMTGKPLNVTLGTDGLVQKIAGFDAIENAMPDPENSSLEERDMIELATGLDVLTNVPETLKIGGTWNSEFTWSHEIGEMDYKTTHKLAQVEDIAGIPVASIDNTATLALKADMEKVNPNPQAPPVNVRMTESSATSRTLVDLERNEIVGVNGSKHTVIELTVEVPTPQGPQTIRRVMNERSQGQLLRVSESDG